MSVRAEHLYDLFISYAKDDREWVQGYLLPALGLPADRVITPAGFWPGMPVVDAFERAVTSSRYTLLILSPAYLTDAWSTFGEQLISHASVVGGFDRLIPLQLKECALPLRVDFRVRLDCTQQANWEAETSRIRDLLSQPEPTPLPIPCPYPGMKAFSSKDRYPFFGRDRDVEKLLYMLSRYPFAAVIGRSGIGKSSLVHAGLVPALGESGLFPGGPALSESAWCLMSLRPGETPMDDLSEALGGTDPADAVARLLEARPHARHLLVVVDQFEELFTLAHEDQVRPFEEALLGLIAVPDCYVLLTVRSDFYGDLTNSSLWPEIKGHRYEVESLTGANLHSAIVKPAEQQGVFLDPVLVTSLVKDAEGEPGILPFVQETMRLLWEQLQWLYLPASAYDDLRNLKAAVATHARRVIDPLPSEKVSIACRMLLRLVQFGAGRDHVRRQLRVDDLRSFGDSAPLFEETLSHLAEERLLTLTGEEKQEGDRKADLAHEVLIQGWLEAEDWFEEWRRAEQDRRHWESQVGSGPLDGAELAEAEAWLDTPGASQVGYSQDLWDLVATSRDRRRRNRLLRIAGVLAFVVLAALVLITLGQLTRQSEESQRAMETQVLVVQLTDTAQAQDAGLTATAQAATAEAAVAAQALGAKALLHLDGQYDLALLLSLESGHITDMVEARSSLLAAMEHNPYLVAYLRGGSGRAESMVFRQDGKTLITAYHDGSVLGWSPETLRPSRVPHLDQVEYGWAMAFSPDGRLLAVARDDGTIVLRLVETGEQYGNVLIGIPDRAEQLVFSSDGKRLASVHCLSQEYGTCSERETQVWDIETQQPVGYPFAQQASASSSVALSQDGRRLAAAECATRDQAGACEAFQIRLWDVDTKRPVGKPLTGYTSWVSSLVFSPDGSLLLSGGCGEESRSGGCQQGEIRLWHVETGTETRGPLASHNDRVTSLAYSAEGALLASGSLDGTILLWGTEDWQLEGEPLAGYAEWVDRMVFSPDGRRLASIDFEGTIILWDLQHRSRLGRSLAGNTDAVISLAFHPDGQIMATGGCWDPSQEESPDQGVITLWSVATGIASGERLTAHSGCVTGVAFSPDGGTLASVGQEGTIILWDTTTWNPRHTLPAGHIDERSGLAFSPDGTTLASGSCADWNLDWGCSQGSIRLWNAKTGEQLGKPLVGHDDEVTNLGFTPDGQTLASFSGDGGSIVLWDVTSWAPRGEMLYGYNEATPPWMFSPDSSTLAFGDSDGTVTLLRLAAQPETGKPLGRHQDWVYCAAFSPDGQLLASAGDDGAIMLWDVARRQQIGPALSGDADLVHSVGFSPDGKTLASIGLDWDAILWDVSYQSWRERACKIVNRNLSAEEWDQYLGADTPYACTCPDQPPGEGVPHYECP